MTASIVHRGPDGAGHWHDAAAGVALGHRRLAVIDLSPAGAQPMHSACGRYVITFNGEIYNHLDLRAALENGGFAPGACAQARAKAEGVVDPVGAALDCHAPPADDGGAVDGSGHGKTGLTTRISRRDPAA